MTYQIKGLIDKNSSRSIMMALSFFLLITIVNAQSRNDRFGEIIKYLDGLSYPEFSGVVLMAKNDSVQFEKAYGYSSLEHGAKNGLNTLFNVASITKTMTAVGILQLVDGGLLDLDVPVGTYLPDFPNTAVRDSVTTHQLLTHTSGLNNFLVNDFIKMGKIHLREVKDYVPLFASEPLLFNPGSSYAYSAAGYIVLGLIIEKLSGKSYFQYLKDHVFDKSGMENTMAIPIDSIIKNKANGYTSYFGESDHLSKNDTFLSMANPAGFYYSNARDLFKFFSAIRKNQLLSEAMARKMMSPLVMGYHTNYGYGISVDKRFDQAIVGHAGGWFGVQCEMFYFEEDGVTVIILSNLDSAEDMGMNRISNFIKHILANKPLPNFN